MFVPALIFAAAAVSATPADTFMQRLANAAVGQKNTVTAGALPPGWTPPAPLPQSLTLLGSVFSPHYQTQIYYETSDAFAALQAYVAQLRAAGYAPKLGVAGQAGFSSGQLMENLTVMCRGNEGVSILAPGKDDLRVSFAAQPAIGACAKQPPRFTSPVPDLYPPAGTTVVAMGGAGMSFGQFNGSTTYSSATYRTPLSAKQLLAAFASQMEGAHWTAQPAFSAPQGAAQSFRYDAGAQHWQATVLLFAGRDPHTYEARLDASGTADTVAAAIVAPRPLARLRTSDVPAALQLAQRIADASLYVRRLPPGFTKAIPTPAGTLIGSTSSVDGVALFYDVTRAQYESYLGKLRAGGWAAMQYPVPRPGGFASVRYAAGTSFCKAGTPIIYAMVRPNTSELTVRIPVARTPRGCAPGEFGPTPAMMQSAPVPLLRAPAGASMRPGSAGIFGGQSAATITGAQSPGTLLAGFAAQFTAAGWTAAAPLANDALGSQSFTHADNSGGTWQAVLTIYRSQKDPKTYYAFIDATQL